MEVRGESFVKNLEIEKEKTKLEEKRNYLEQQKEQTVLLDSNDNIQNNIDDTLDNELDDIKLDSNKSNKQNYVVLAFALVLLFLITIIIIRLVSSPSTKSNLDDNSFIQDDVQEQIYPKQNEIKQSVKINDTIDESLNINDIEQNEEEIFPKKTQVKKDIKTTELENNIFEISRNESIQKKDPIIEKHVVSTKKEVTKPKNNPYKNIVIKQEVKKPTKHINKISNKIKGYYVQVGAFSKKPNKKLLAKLRTNSLKYTLYNTTIKGRKYIKLLVGPYKSYGSAKNRLSKIRRVSNNTKAYIARFK